MTIEHAYVSPTVANYIGANKGGLEIDSRRFSALLASTMTLKSQIDYQCPQCQLTWLPFKPGLNCPSCGRAIPDSEVTGIIAEALESARFNKRLYGKMEVEYWITRRLGDRYLEWGFKALQLADVNREMPSSQAALSALMDLNLEEMTPYREHVLGFLVQLVDAFKVDVKQRPLEWEKMPEPEKPFFGRKVIDDQST
jgi:hypothetical protein